MEQLTYLTNFANLLNESTTPVVMTFGAVIGLALAIFMILKKIHPAYSLIAGAFVGGIIGLVWNYGIDSLQYTVNYMLDGSRGMVTATVRILTAGVLAGILIKSGAAKSIAAKITNIFPGEKGAIFALSLAAMILTAVGVFIDVAVITVGPIALATAKRTKLPVMALLLAMIGGGKAGNMLSPNPNAIAASETFGVDLFQIMIANIPAALIGLAVAFFLAVFLSKKLKGTDADVEVEFEEEDEELPEFWAAILGPLVTIVLLSLRPIFNIAIDPLIALPIGGLAGVIAMGKLRHTNEYITFGLSRMSGIAILLLATGTLAGIISNSGIQYDLVTFLNWANVPAFLLAPIAGILFSAATASTTAGVAVAGSAFAGTITASGTSALAGAAMVHTGATVLDHLPHGSFFHATGGVANLEIKNRLKLIPYETLVGLAMTIVSTIMWGVIIG